MTELKAEEYIIRDLFTDGRAVAVPLEGGKLEFLAGPVPGDRLALNPESGEVEYLELSPARQPSFCGYYPSCGGCSVQQLKYPALLALKKAQLEHLFPEAKVKFYPSSEASAFAYRKKFFWHYDQGSFGLLRRGSHQLIEIQDCPLASKALQAATKIFQEYLRRDYGQLGLHLRQGRGVELSFLLVLDENRLKLEANGKRGIFLADLKSLGQVGQALAEIAAAFKAEGLDLKLSGINLRAKTKAGENLGPRTFLLPELNKLHEFSLAEPFSARDFADLLLTETVLDRQFKILPGAFFQVNPQLFAASVEAARSQLGKVESALDLYCGTGAWGLSVLPRSCRYFGLDIDPLSLETTALNAAFNGFTSYSCERLNLKRKSLDIAPVDLVLLDPPRAGLSPAVTKALSNSSVSKIFYLSCHAATLARDLKNLASHFKLEYLSGFDYFPWTMGYESLALLSRVDAEE
ncbi:MAG: hypothetical protein Q4P08_00480 [Eubacteriales bacterium]|nr:hypothetical protein [Eubacteriales bacterium]